jgi:hypothetical protein
MVDLKKNLFHSAISRTNMEPSFLFCVVHNNPFLDPQEVAFDENAGTFVNPRLTRKYSGVTVRLAHAFYPKYKAKPYRYYKKKSKKKKCKQSGQERGKTIDRQLTRWAHASVASCSKCQELRQGLDLVSNSTNLPVRLCRDPYATAVRAKLTKLRLVPVASQVVVFYDSIAMATAVDLVCRDSNGDYVLIEVKSGFDQNLRRSSGSRLQKPFEHQFDCPLNQFHLQLLVTSILFRQTFPQCKENLAWPQILVTNAAGCESIPLAKWAVTKSDTVIDYM